MWTSARYAIGAALLLQTVQLPAPRGYVNDFANVIPAATQDHIQKIIDDVRAKSGGEIVVVTLSDIVAREAFSPTQLPVGVVTGVVGGPYLLWLLARSNRKGTGG